MVTGVSGAGKSSLVRSVLVGQLRGDPERGECLHRRDHRGAAGHVRLHPLEIRGLDVDPAAVEADTLPDERDGALGAGRRIFQGDKAWRIRAAPAHGEDGAHAEGLHRIGIEDRVFQVSLLRDVVGNLGEPLREELVGRLVDEIPREHRGLACDEASGPAVLDVLGLLVIPDEQCDLRDLAVLKLLVFREAVVAQDDAFNAGLCDELGRMRRQRDHRKGDVRGVQIPRPRDRSGGTPAQRLQCRTRLRAQTDGDDPACRDLSVRVQDRSLRELSFEVFLGERCRQQAAHRSVHAAGGAVGRTDVLEHTHDQGVTGDALRCGG